MMPQRIIPVAKKPNLFVVIGQLQSFFNNEVQRYGNCQKTEYDGVNWFFDFLTSYPILNHPKHQVQ
jgi:hypothetical protein